MRSDHVLRRLADLATLAILAVALVLLAKKSGAPASADSLDFALAADSLISPVRAYFDSGGATLLFDDEYTTGGLIYLFRSDCEVCAIQRDEWVEISALARTIGIPVFALTPEIGEATASDYFSVEESQIRVGRLANPQGAFETFGTSIVPTTILVGRDAQVRYHHRGLMEAEASAPLRRLIDEVGSSQVRGREN